MNASRFLPWTLLSLLLASTTARAEYSTDVRQAIQQAVDKARESLMKAGLPSTETISVLPIRGDEDRYVEGLLKNAVTSAGLTYVEGKSDPFWDELLIEIEWDERKEDILDPATLDKFGKLKSTQHLLYGTVREASASNRRIYVELELHLSSISTKQHLWGDLIAQRFYLPGDVTGLVELNREIRRLLETAIQAKAESIQKSPKLKEGLKVAMAPLAGDIDGYVGTLVENMLSSTPVTPSRVDAVTVGEIRQILRDAPDVVDAVLVGAVRDLSRELELKEPLRDLYELNAEVQVRIESAKDGSVLWSETISATGQEEEVRTPLSVATANWKWVLIAAAVVLGIIVLFFMMASMRRSR